MYTRGKRGVVALIVALALVLGSVAWAGSRCQIVPATDARLRLEVWGREWAGAKGAVAAHSARRVAWLADRQGTVIEVLFLVTLQEAAPGRLDQRPCRPQWVRCALRAADPPWW